MKDICMFGASHAGLVSGVCFAEFGNRVTLVDTDSERIDLLKSGRSPYCEYGLEGSIQRNLRMGRIVFSTDVRTAVEEADVVFIAAETRPLPGGGMDLSGVYEAAETIAKYIDAGKLIVCRSTVPVGTTRQLEEIVRAEMEKRGVFSDFEMACNPDFLREGRAMEDFMKPWRVLIGAETEHVQNVLLDVYRPLVYKEVPFVFTDTRTAEMAKYASNAFLAMKVAFINEIANLCESQNANAVKVAEVLGMDPRIGPEYLSAGPGFGGSGVPKDVRALAGMGRACKTPLRLIEAALEANEAQRQRMADKVIAALGGVILGREIAVLGLTFKPETDDVWEAPALRIVEILAQKGARVRVYDPLGMQAARAAFEAAGVAVEYAAGAYEACAGSDAVVLLTAWDQFAQLNLERVKAAMKGNHFFDFRNVFRRADMEAFGFIYDGVGV